MTERPGSRQTQRGEAGEESLLGRLGEQSIGRERAVPRTPPLQKGAGGHRPAGSPKAKSYVEPELVNASKGQAESGLGNKTAIGTVGPYTGQDTGRAWGPTQQRERRGFPLEGAQEHGVPEATAEHPRLLLVETTQVGLKVVGRRNRHTRRQWCVP